MTGERYDFVDALRVSMGRLISSRAAFEPWSVTQPAQPTQPSPAFTFLSHKTFRQASPALPSRPG